MCKFSCVTIIIILEIKVFLNSRTSNNAEAWHRRWNELVGRAHIILFTLIKELQKEQSKFDADIEAILRGAPKLRPTNVQRNR